MQPPLYKGQLNWPTGGCLRQVPLYQYAKRTKINCQFFILFFTSLPPYSCRVYSYPFWIGLLVPFGVIYIINWTVFLLIIISVVCKPSVQYNKGKLRKMKENFVIALVLSVLFGLSWSIGLLATSDLPDAVRRPAEWVFTILTVFLGVYIFLLYVVRSAEARKVWKRWLLCQCRSARGAASSTAQPRLLRTLSDTLGSWRNSSKTDKNSRSGQNVNDKQNTLERTLRSSKSDTFSSKAALTLSAMGSTAEEVTEHKDKSICYVNEASSPSTFDAHAPQQYPEEEEEEEEEEKMFYYYY